MSAAQLAPSGGAGNAPRLGLATRISYGLGSVAQGVGAVTVSTTVINYYLIAVVGLRPALVGTLIFVSLLVDAVLDPAIGRWSDTFRSPWGRRHPFMYASAIPITLSTCLLWWRPPELSGWGLVGYVFTTLVVLRVSGGLYQIPSDALSPELAPDYHERTGLISWRWFFALAGFVGVTVALNGVFLRKDATHPLGQNDPAGYLHFGFFAAAVGLVSILVSATATHRYIPSLNAPPPRRQSFVDAWREMLTIVTNPSLVAVMGCGLIGGVATGINDSITAFMNFFFWGLAPQTVALMTGLALPASLIGVFIAPALSRRLDKKRTMITVFVLSIFVSTLPVALRLLGVLPPNGSVLIPLILAANLFVAAMLGLIGFVIISSMIADVAEDSAVRTGVRSEGLLFAANGLVPKITGGVGAVAGNLMLELVGFPHGAMTAAHASVDPAVMRQLALVSLPVGAILNLCAVAVLGFYRIDRRSHEANLEALKIAASPAQSSSRP